MIPDPVHSDKSAQSTIILLFLGLRAKLKKPRIINSEISFPRAGQTINRAPSNETNLAKTVCECLGIMGINSLCEEKKNSSRRKSGRKE